MPILHLSQLIGVAAGLEESELKFKRHVVSVDPVTREARGLTCGSRGSRAPRPRRGSPGVISRRAGCGSRRWPCPVPGLPAELEGLRIAHLSDFHLGLPSRGSAAVERAVDWVEERQPDLR